MKIGSKFCPSRCVSLACSYIYTVHGRNYGAAPEISRATSGQTPLEYGVLLAVDTLTAAADLLSAVVDPLGFFGSACEALTAAVVCLLECEPWLATDNLAAAAAAAAATAFAVCSLNFGVLAILPAAVVQVPTVLVVGATGEMGRVVVRKLLLRGKRSQRGRPRH